MNISKIIKIPNNSTLLYVRHIITIVRGITINKPFVNICEACFLVKYSSSIFKISSLLLNFNIYLFINGVLE